MDRVYLVVGYQGDYSDASEHAVRAFERHADALAFQAECERHVAAMPKLSAAMPMQPTYRTSAQLQAHFASPEWKRWQQRQTAYAERVRQYWAAGPDTSAGGDTEYRIDTVAFGRDSTALNTAPARVRLFGRQYDLA